MNPNIQFPDRFLWGTATSAHQVEGGNRNQWSEWEESPDRINYLTGLGFDPKDFISGQACDHYNRYEEDFNLALKMNNNAHRFSIEWSRIEPQENRINLKEIEHYRKVIRALKGRGLEPFVTLWHWTFPVWFAKRGGFEKRGNIIYFTRFCERVVSEFKNDVKFWITINEPEMYALNSYLKGHWPPNVKNMLLFRKVFNNLAEAHCGAYDAVHDIADGAQVGIAKNNSYFEGWLTPVANWFWNNRFLSKIKDCQDFIGLNYYFHNHIKGFSFNQNENKSISDIGWEIYPEGIYQVLKDLKKYQKPIYITENGIADAKDQYRAKFIVDHLKLVHKAIQESIDVRGYFHWSLLDNFEWTHGFAPRFGLVEIDYKTLSRKPRYSSSVYAEIAKSNAVTSKVEELMKIKENMKL